MKPTSPEDHELDKMSSEASERYRAGSREEPPEQVDAAIVAAARREVDRTRQRRSWPVPASAAAVLVIGISLMLLMRDNEPPLMVDHLAQEAKLAKPAPPQLALNTQPKARENYRREDRPSRERTARPEREPSNKQQEVPALHDSADSVATSQSGAAAAVPAVPAKSKSAEQEQLRRVEPSEVLLAKRSKASSDAGAEPPASAPMRKDDLAAGDVRPQDWLRKIEDLLRDGKDADAREQLMGFRRQFPGYALPPKLQELLPADQR